MGEAGNSIIVIYNIDLTSQYVFKLSIIHRYNFMDLNSGIHIQNVERTQVSTKWVNKKH